ncbi:MAG: L-aspartate oxidase [Flavobacteriaceae bacterium]|nr:L-aspartate oxidase [Flavobacteriaceae bacterium]
MPNFDFLVVGSGIAGLSYAIKTAEHFPEAKLAIVTKSDENESNTKYAQGGIAVVIDQIRDSYEQHIQDTLKAGDGLCDSEIVKIVVTEGYDRLNDLLKWGVDFDKNHQGDFDLGLEGGHTENRILHHKDLTGYEIEKNLLEQIAIMPNIQVFSQHFAVDLITQHQLASKNEQLPQQRQCFGAYVFNPFTKTIEIFSAKITLLATGGVGQIYQNTTNPTIATGDGIAMAYRAKAQIENMEFIQFHPTALFHPQTVPSFLISEAVRGFGALLRNKSGQFFMEKYDPRKELASRDIVSRAIDSELKKSGDECVYLDCRHLDQKAFENHFPTILQKVNEIGIDLKKDTIPVVPAAHYLCGGIQVDAYGQTTIDNLYACGECSNTGLHGANRLASNSLLEALVFSHRCYLSSIEKIKKTQTPRDILPWDEGNAKEPEELILITHNRKELQIIMNDYVGIIRSEERLSRALNRLKILFEETEALYKRCKISTELIELRNMISVAYLVVKQSQKRSENKGAFFKIRSI